MNAPSYTVPALVAAIASFQFAPPLEGPEGAEETTVEQIAAPATDAMAVYFAEAMKLLADTDLPNASEDSSGAPRATDGRASGVREVGLRASSLRYDGGLESGARGLTPTDEWRAIFPIRQRH